MGLKRGAFSSLTAVGHGLHFCVPRSKGPFNLNSVIAKTVDIFLYASPLSLSASANAINRKQKSLLFHFNFIDRIVSLRMDVCVYLFMLSGMVSSAVCVCKQLDEIVQPLICFLNLSILMR